MAKIPDHCQFVGVNLPKVDVAAIDELGAEFGLSRSEIIRRAMAKGLLKLVEADPELAARYREARARLQNVKRRVFLDKVGEEAHATPG